MDRKELRNKLLDKLLDTSNRRRDWVIGFLAFALVVNSIILAGIKADANNGHALQAPVGASNSPVCICKPPHT